MARQVQTTREPVSNPSRLHSRLFWAFWHEKRSICPLKRLKTVQKSLFKERKSAIVVFWAFCSSNALLCHSDWKLYYGRLFRRSFKPISVGNTWIVRSVYSKPGRKRNLKRKKTARGSVFALVFVSLAPRALIHGKKRRFEFSLFVWAINRPKRTKTRSKRMIPSASFKPCYFLCFPIQKVHFGERTVTSNPETISAWLGWKYSYIISEYCSSVWTRVQSNLTFLDREPVDQS